MFDVSEKPKIRQGKMIIDCSIIEVDLDKCEHSISFIIAIYLIPKLQDILKGEAAVKEFSKYLKKVSEKDPTIRKSPRLSVRENGTSSKLSARNRKEGKDAKKLVNGY